MKKIHIKVCGMTTSENIRQLNQLPVDTIGFIFYPGSPRCLPPKMWDYIASFGTNKKKTGVFVNETPLRIKEIAIRCRLDSIQLHGNESPEFCQQIKAMGYEVVKVFSISSASDFGKCSSYTEACDLFLFDTKCWQHGGSGLKFNWELLSNYQLSKPYILSGGIGPDDAHAIHLMSQNSFFHGIDLNSQFEEQPGIKNLKKLKLFIEKIKQL